MPHDFFQYLIEVCRVFVAAKFAGGFDEALRLDLRAVEELLGNRTGALVVKAPPRAIGQHAPTEFAGREVFHAPQVNEASGLMARFLRRAGRSDGLTGAAIVWIRRSNRRPS